MRRIIQTAKVRRFSVRCSIASVEAANQTSARQMNEVGGLMTEAQLSWRGLVCGTKAGSDRHRTEPRGG